MHLEANLVQAIWYAFGEYLLIGGGLFGAFLCSLVLISKGARRERAKLAWVGLVGVLATALVSDWGWVRDNGPGGDGVVARLFTDDGVECRVVQTWNDWFEPYTVSFYYKPQGSAGGWCYI